MELQTVVQVLEKFSPLDLSEDWDNVGLLINPLEPRNIKRILLSIDLTEAVADEAIFCKAGLIVAYHPILFRPVGRLNAENACDRTVMKLIREHIAVYSPHTALDAVDGGVNDWLAEGPGKGTISVLRPIPGSDAGQGRLVKLECPVSLETLARRIKRHLGVKYLRIATAASRTAVRSVALCAGAGADAFVKTEADCYLTGEMSHHQVLTLAAGGAHVILCEHTHTERGYLPLFAEKLGQTLGSEVDICVSEIDADPLQFN